MFKLRLEILELMTEVRQDRIKARNVKIIQIKAGVARNKARNVINKS